MNQTDLIVKYLSREATHEEIKQLKFWVEASIENENKFAELKNSFALASSKLAPDNRTANFEELINQFLKKNKTKKITLSRVYKIAAAIFFPVLLAVSAWLYYNQYFVTSEPVYTEVIAPPKHNSQVLLSDGTQVWLSPESKLIYEQQYGKNSRHVKLIGEGYFEVVRNTKIPFIVETQNLNIKVLGTSFNVEAYNDDERIRTTLVRGAVELNSEKLKSPVRLTPGDRFTLDLVNNSAEIEKVNTEIYRLVKDGLLIFKRNNLNEVCRKLERWFMIPIEYDGKGNTDLEFTAKFEDESIERILEIVSETFPINYQIRNNQIIIKYKN